jgi:hypothetical protein
MSTKSTKKRSSAKKPERTAAQKAATRRMIKANKAAKKTAAAPKKHRAASGASVGALKDAVASLDRKVAKIAEHNKRQDKAILAVAEETDKHSARLDRIDATLVDMREAGPSAGWRRFGGAVG